MANRQVTQDVSDNIIAAAVMAQNFWSIKNLRLLEPHPTDHKKVVFNLGANYIPGDIGGHWFLADTAVEIDAVGDLDTGALAAGTDYYTYECTDGTSLFFTVSANATVPTGFDADHSRKIGGFHTLCAAVAHNTALTAWAADTVMAVGTTRRKVAADGYMYRVTAIAGDFKTHAATEPDWASISVGQTIVDDQVTWIKEQHALEGYAAKDILPASVWCLKHRAKSLVNVGLVYSNGIQKWVDIYLQSGTGIATTSVNGGTITDTRTWMDHVDDGNAVGKRLPRDGEFQSIAAGSNEETNIFGSGDPVTTGGHSDTAGRRMISNLGAEDCCGALWQWLQDQSAKYDAAIVADYVDLPGSKGSLYLPVNTNDIKLLAGASWINATASGSRARHTAGDRVYAGSDISARFVSEPL